MMDVPSFKVLGCHKLDRRAIREFVHQVRRFDYSLDPIERKNVRLFLDRHKGNLFWECETWRGQCPIGFKCRRSVKGFCICVCSSVTPSLLVVLKNFVQIFYERGTCVDSHRQRLSFVTYIDKHGSKILNEV